MKEARHIELNKAQWDKWASLADGKGWKYEQNRKIQDQVISFIDIGKNMRFLDIGCGTGRGISLASARINGKGEFYGVDLSAKMIEKAKERFQDKNNFHLIEANAESIPLESNFFDVILCTNSFHHYFNPGKAMREMSRLLKQGGKLYILDPTADSLLMKIINKIIKLLEPEHVKMYSTKEFQQLMQQAGIIYLEGKIIQGEKLHIGQKDIF